MPLFKFNGLTSAFFDIIVNDIGARRKPEQEAEHFEVPLSDRAHVIFYPHHKPYERELVITFPYGRKDEVFRWLAGSGYLETIDDPFICFSAHVMGIETTDNYAKTPYCTCRVRFLIDPYAYLLSGLEELPLMIGLNRLMNPGTWPSKPLFKTDATGDFEIETGGNRFVVKGQTGLVQIDSKLMITHKDRVNIGEKTEGLYPELATGEVIIKLSGAINSAILIPRWCEL